MNRTVPKLPTMRYQQNDKVKRMIFNIGRSAYTIPFSIYLGSTKTRRRKRKEEGGKKHWEEGTKMIVGVRKGRRDTDRAKGQRG